MRDRKILSISFGLMGLLFCLQSCESFLRSEVQENAVAKLGDQYLLLEDIPSYLYQNTSPQDSLAIVNDYINQWAAKELLIQKSLINLPVAKMEAFDRLVANYKSDLYTLAYKEALVNSRSDTLIGSDELAAFYANEQQNFLVKEKLIRLRFVSLPRNYSDVALIAQKLKTFEEADIRYLDSISIQFNKLNLNDSIWVPLNRILKEIGPLARDNEEIYLKKSQFFLVEDAFEVYLLFVNNYMLRNEVAPLVSIENTIRKIVFNKRKLDFIKQFDKEILQDAIRTKKFQLYR
jgi:hypothetical protein